MVGRISRNGIPADWSAPKTWPGLAPTTTSTTFYYTEYDYSIPLNGNYFQIEVYDPTGSVFVAAYLNSFTPAPGPTSTNYLGDEGTSEFFDGFASFQVYISDGSTLDLVVNNVNALSGGVGPAYWITVEAFSDTQYTDPSVPEPASMALSLGGLAVFLLARRRRPARQ